MTTDDYKNDKYRKYLNKCVVYMKSIGYISKEIYVKWKEFMFWVELINLFITQYARASI